jgi:CHAT domain-containing protein
MKRSIDIWIAFLFSNLLVSMVILSHQVQTTVAAAPIPQQAQPAAIPSNAQEITLLETGKPIERELTGGQGHLYRVALAAAEYANLSIEQRGIDVVVQLLGPDGTLIAEFDSESRKQGKEIVGLVADSAVNYGLRIKARYSKAPTARYEVRVVDVRPATEHDRSAFEARKLSTDALKLEASGKFEEAIQLVERASALAEKTSGPDDAFVGRLLIKLGFLERRKGEYRKAEQTFQRAVTVNQKALGREDPQTALALRGLGLLYVYTNEYAKAEPLLQEQLDITERTLGSEHPAVVSALMDLSALHQYREDLEHALSERQRALAIAEKTLDPDDTSLIAAVSNLGDLYSLLGDNQRAEPLLERALAMVEQKYGREHFYTATPLQNLGIIARQTKRYARALEFLWRAEAVREKALGSRHPDTATLLINIANIYNSQGDYTRALELHQRALDILTSVVGPYHRLTLAAVGDVARTYAAQGNVARAIEYQRRYDEALEKNVGLNLAIGSEREKLAYLSSTFWHSDRTISLHAREAPADRAALELAALSLLRRKGRVLDAMSGSNAALRQRLDPEDRKLLDELGETNAKLAKLALGGPGKTPASEYQKQLTALEQQRERLETAVSARSAEFRAQSQPVNLEAARAAIPPGAALIEFAKYRPFNPKGENEDESYEEPRYIAYVLRQQGEVQWRDLGLAKEVDDAAAALRQALRDWRRKDVQELARSLDQRIMQPIRPLVGDAKQLLVSPDGDLNLIPFEALVDEQGRHLLERYSISYLTAGRDLLRMQVARASKSGPVVLADPLFGEPQTPQVARVDQRRVSPPSKRRSVTTGEDVTSVYFAPLTGTAEEARSIKALFPEAEVLTGQDATKASLKRVDAPRILHIATHGFFLHDPADDATQMAANTRVAGTRAISATVRVENPLLRSGLALAGANLSKTSNDDGLLTALEASGLNLWGTKLVTLSACDTGVGQVKNGEGVFGLRRAFVLAGAETLVMSLWPVSDYVTRELMSGYYEGLKRGQGRREALRQVQLAMLKRKERQHPFYWAGFIQSGEWASLDGTR